MLAVAWWGCGPARVPIPDGGAHSAAHHSGGAVEPSLAVSCAVGDHPLRAVCSVDVAPPAAVTLEAARTGGVPRTAASALVAAHHELALDLLAPDSDYDVVATAGPTTAETSLRTGSPPSFAASRLQVSGVASVPYVGANLPCAGGMAAVGIWETGTGDLVGYWLLQNPGSSTGLNMVRFTREQTFLGITGTHVVELDRAGRDLLRRPYPEILHHDLFRASGRTWLLWTDWPSPRLKLDGVIVWNREGVEEGRFFEHDTWPVPSDAEGDWAHTNAIWVDGADAWMSLFEQDAIVKIDADPASPTFGQLRWVLAGGPNELGQDFLVDWSHVGGADAFGRPHNVHVTLDGRLGFLDNDGGRALILSVDEAAHTAVVDEAYPSGEGICEAQGTAAESAPGHVLVGCSGLHVREYAPLGREPDWDATLRCDNGAGVPGGPNAMGVLRWYPLAGW